MHKRPLCTLALLGLLVFTCASQGAQLDERRARFLDAEKALKSGERDRFEHLASKLRDYPLHPYLEYAALSERLGQAEAAEVERFLDAHATTPLEWRMRANWLEHLAKKRRWSEYLRFYRPTSHIGRRCHQLQALIATGQADKALPLVAEIWLHGRSRPRACDPVFAAWQKAGYRTAGLTWQRIEKALEVGEWRLARYLGRGLSKTDRSWLERWIALFRNPRKASDADSYRDAHPYREAMLSHAIRRLARWDGLEALGLWRGIKSRFGFDRDQIRRTEHYIVRNLVRTPGDTAYDFIRGVDVDAADLLVQQARIRAALLREDWPQVIGWIGALPKAERDKEHWSYWLARALEGTGNADAAAALYAQVARERTYYGFLAADRSGREYHLAHIETPVDEAMLRAIGQLDAVKRTRELFALERWNDARREWREVTRGMDEEHLKAAATLAKRHGWHDRAIFTLARTGFWDDLELRFPLEHIELVKENAQRQGIDIAWVFAVMRQESAFMSNARSHAGAMGLMQLMPATARNVAHKVLKKPPPPLHELLRPDTNIALGSAYLKQVKEELGDSAMLATAAYNAGPHRVSKWLPERTLPADIWIELVPFKETRGYLRRVLAYTVIYEKRMGKTPIRLRDRLHPVPPSISLLSGTQATEAVRSAG